MKTLFYAALAALALLVFSCQKAQTDTHANVLNANHKLTFIYSREIKPGEVVTPVAIDSNTAIVKASGDTLFPRWYYKEKAATAPNTRQAGIMSVRTAYQATITTPKKTAATSQVLTITCPNVYQSAEITIETGKDLSYYIGFVTPSSPGAAISVQTTVPVTCETYYKPEINTYGSSDPEDQVIQTSKMPFYAYSFQQYLGQGTAYGADMKMLQFNGQHTGSELLSVIANRSANGVNGLSYLIYKDVDKNGFANYGHTGLRTLQMQSSSSAPKGAAAAVASLDNNTENDMVLATYTKLNTESSYTIKYLVGLNINDTNGVPTWLQQPNAPRVAPGFGNDIVDIGAVIVDFDNNGTKDLMFMGFANSGIWYRIGYNLNITNGSADFSSPAKLLYTPDNNILGGGMDGKSYFGDFVVGFYSNESGTARFQTMIWSWDLANQTFSPTVKLLYFRETVGAATAGAGVAMGWFDAGDLTYDILSMAYVGGDFRYVVDFDLNSSPEFSSSSPYFRRGLCGARTN